MLINNIYYKINKKQIKCIIFLIYNHSFQKRAAKAKIMEMVTITIELDKQSSYLVFMASIASSASDLKDEESPELKTDEVLMLSITAVLQESKQV